MIEVTQLVISLAVGVVLGMAYFGGLWWTVARLDRVHKPALFFLFSLTIRLACLLSAYFLILQLGILPLMFSLVGLLLARIVVLRLADRHQTVVVR